MYRVCGCVMLACIALVGIVGLLPNKTFADQFNPVFWLESTAVVAFGVSWLTKGETIFKDK